MVIGRCRYSPLSLLLRLFLCTGILLSSVSSLAQDDSVDNETSHRQQAIDDFVEGTRSLESHFVQPGCPECERIFADEDLLEWSIQYGTRSGFGGTNGIRIWSDGRIALCSRRSCEEFKLCMSLRANPTMLNLLEEQIRRFEAPATGQRIVRVPSTCMDESQHVVRVDVGNTQTGFMYPAPPSCRRGNEAPAWMIDTAEMMRGHLEWIWSCQTDEEDSSSHGASSE